jgi:hypothetical protein
MNSVRTLEVRTRCAFGLADHHPAEWRRCPACRFFRPQPGTVPVAPAPATRERVAPASGETVTPSLTRRGFGSGRGRLRVYATAADRLRAWRVRKREQATTASRPGIAGPSHDLGAAKRLVQPVPESGSSQRQGSPSVSMFPSMEWMEAKRRSPPP